MIDIKANILFSLEILHRYYTSGLCRDFTIAPSSATASILAGCKLIYRQNGNQLFVASPLNARVVPPARIIPPANQPLTFFLTCNNVLFTNFTDIPLAGLNAKLWYFTNRNNNPANSKSFITAKIPAYSASTGYQPGDLVLSGTTIYQAIRPSGLPLAPVGTGDASYWGPTNDGAYATANDLLTFLPPVSDFPLAAAAATVNYQVDGYNAPGDYSKPVVPLTTINYPAAVSSFPLDLSALPPGKYILTVNTIPVPIYLNPELKGTSSVCGVIDIYPDSNVPAGYGLFGPGNSLLSPLYSILFLNRATIWKYVLVSTKAAVLTDQAGVYQFTCTVPVPPQPVIVTLTSDTPVPLSESVLKLVLTQTGSPTLKHVSCADPQRLQTISLPAGNYYCSEIYVNY